MKPNNLGKKFTVEECQKVKIGDYLSDFKHKFKEAILSSALDATGQEIGLTSTKTGFNGVRYWFRCPICDKRIGVVLVHPMNHKVGCRECLNVDYRKRLYKGMCESNLLD